MRLEDIAKVNEAAGWGARRLSAPDGPANYIRQVCEPA